MIKAEKILCMRGITGGHWLYGENFACRELSGVKQNRFENTQAV